MKLAYLILHYKDQHVTNRCLASVHTTEQPGDKVIVIDASHDFDRTPTRPIEIVRTSRYNPGFARSMNEGAKLAQLAEPDILVFLNNDTVLDPGFRTGIVNAFAGGGTQLAAVGPKVVYRADPSTVWSAGGSISRWRMSAAQFTPHQNASETTGVYSTGFISGAVFAVKRSAFSRMGGWPEAYLFGGEDWELSFRLRETGYELAIAADVTVEHEVDPGDGHGYSHRLSDMRFVVNSFLIRILFAQRVHGTAAALLFRLRLVAYIWLVMPWRWANVGDAHSLPQKALVSARLGLLVACWSPRTRITWDSLQDMAIGVAGKAP